MRIVFDGHKAFDEYEKLFLSAKKRIWICMYMIRFDERTKKLWRILEQKHEEGVDVRVWCDAWGCLRNIWRFSVTPFCRIFGPKWWRPGTRNHAKIFLVDDATAVISGRNLTKRYFDEWVDASIFLTKKETIENVKKFIRHVEQNNPTPLPLSTILRYTNPLRYEKTVYHFILEHIVKSQKEITIASPYFVIDEALEELLKAAMDRGVNITVIVPAKPEHKLARTFNRINFQRIHHKNLTVMRSEGMFHSKVMLFDDVALVGSANFDNRSFKRNLELSVVLEKKHAPQIRKHLQEVADHSVKYNWFQRAYDHLLYHFTRHLMELL